MSSVLADAVKLSEWADYVVLYDPKGGCPRSRQVGHSGRPGPPRIETDEKEPGREDPTANRVALKIRRRYSAGLWPEKITNGVGLPADEPDNRLYIHRTLTHFSNDAGLWTSSPKSWKSTHELDKP